MALMNKTLEKFFSQKPDFQLKILALVIFAIMILLACYPLARGTKEFTTFHATVVFLGTAGIIVTILSDRIVSLNFSKGELRLELSKLKKDVKDNISKFQSELAEKPSKPDRFTQAIKDKLTNIEKMVDDKTETTNPEKMLREAKSIGQAMGMLREIMDEYHKFRPKT